MLQSKRGFTIVELLVAIIIIGILATLVAINFTAVLPKARDNERKTETETIASYLETEFQRNGQYPSVATMTGSVSGVQAVLKGIPIDALAAPGVAAGTNSIVSFTVAPPSSLTTSQYGYWIPDSGNCTNPATYTTTDCATFILAYKKEVGSSFVYICGRGANVNNTKAIFPGPNGMPSFSDTSCSNF
jgi:prepilin-type N-terminal cleavage/methylation domain-containing protein